MQSTIGSTFFRAIPIPCSTKVVSLQTGQEYHEGERRVKGAAHNSEWITGKCGI